MQSRPPSTQSTMAGMLAGYLGMIAVSRIYMRGRSSYTLTLAMQVMHQH